MQFRHLRAFLAISLLTVAAGCNSQNSPGPASTTPPTATTVSVPAASSPAVQAAATTSTPAKSSPSAAAQPVAAPKPSTQPFKLVDVAVPSLIAFSGNGIALATPDGKTIRQLPTDPKAFTPLWSPDGRDILYTISDAPRQGIWVAPADGGAPRQVTKGGAGLFVDRDWSPDGKRIVYNDNSTNRMGIFVVDLASGAEKNVAVKGDAAGEPSWSPDGKWIAYAAGSGIRLVNPDDPSMTRMIPGKGFVDKAAWTPDGQKFAMIDSDQGNVMLIDVASGTSQTLAKDPGRSRGGPMVWSPDGRRLLFFGSNSYGGSTEYNQLWGVDADGKNLQLYMEATGVADASWSPDGAAIAVTSDKNSDQQLIHVMNADGSRERAIAVGAWPAWSPKLASTNIDNVGQPIADLPTSKTKSFFGLFGLESNSELSSRVGQPNEPGLLVGGVVPGSPAEKAGIATKDLLFTVNGKRLDSIDAFNAAMNVKPGTQLTIDLLRAGKPQTVVGTTAEQPGNYGMVWNKLMNDIMDAAPNDPVSLLFAANIDTDAALITRYLDRVLQLDPNFATAYLQRGETYSGLDNDKARADLNKVLQLGGDDLKAQAKDDLSQLK